MLDNTLIIYLSDSGEAHHPNLLECPVILLGNLGGKLKSKNRLLEYPKYGAAGHKTLANLYLAFLHTPPASLATSSAFRIRSCWISIQGDRWRN